MSQLGIARPSPRYVERGGDVVYRPPFQARGAAMWLFIVDADIDCLTAFCDRSFNYPLDRYYDRGSDAARRFTPVAPFAVVSFLRVSSFSGSGGDGQLGSMVEVESSIWFPMFDDDRDVFVWAVPYMFVNGSVAMAGGREIYGLPKQVATLSIPDDLDNLPDELSVTALAIPEFGSAARANDELVYEARNEAGGRLTPSPVRLEEAYHALASPPARQKLPDLTRLARPRRGRENTRRADDRPAWVVAVRRGGTLALAQVLAIFTGDLLRGSLPMVSLKQFRAADDAERACYQAIVELSNKTVAMRTWGVLPEGEYQLRFSELDGVPICRDLGIKPGGQRPRTGLWLEFDFDIPLGTVLWEATNG